MVQLILGEKGKGKTKILLDKVNEESAKANGNVVFLDKDAKHMYELKNKIRFINTSDYFISDSSEFIGFICGIISADHDLEQIFIDRFLKITLTEGEKTYEVIRKLDKISDQFHITIVISVSVTKADLPEDLKERVVVSL
ncbi:MAG: twitching motility protein PilT [Lachnospiraceae bacterium]|nr:twitching motility protein PilT [Lachnospiraceae bacterium]